MPIDELLLSKLVCPKCRGKLTLQDHDSSLDCPGCKLRYEIQRFDNNVLTPNMIIEQAKEIKT